MEGGGNSFVIVPEVGLDAGVAHGWLASANIVLRPPPPSLGPLSHFSVVAGLATSLSFTAPFPGQILRGHKNTPLRSPTAISLPPHRRSRRNHHHHLVFGAPRCSARVKRGPGQGGVIRPKKCLLPH